MKTSAFPNLTLAAIGLALLSACNGGDLLVGSAGGNAGTHNQKTLAATACDFSAPTPRAVSTGNCSNNGWCWENSTPTGTAIHLASAANPDVEGFGSGWPAVGESEDDGTRALFVWSKHELRSLEKDQWVQHPLPAFDGEIISAFARSRDDIWLSTTAHLAEDFRSMSHFDGSRWSTAKAPEFAVSKLQAAADGTLWGMTLNQYGQMVRFDGSSWTVIDEPTPAEDPEFTVEFRAISAHEVWRIRARTLEHYVDGEWASFVIPDSSGSDLNNSLLTLQVMADGSVWLAGFARETIPSIRHDLFIQSDSRPKGLLLRFDGATFSRIELPEVGGIQALFGTASDLWLGSTDGEMVHYDGQHFSKVEKTPHDTAAFAKRGNALWALAVDWGNRNTGGIVHWDGETWSAYAPLPTVETITSIWGSAFDDVWAVGTRGLRLHFDGESWRNTQTESDVDDYAAVWGTSKNSVFTVTSTGLQHFDGQGFRAVAEAELSGPSYSISGLSDDSIWIAAGDLYHYDGKTLQRVDTPVSKTQFGGPVLHDTAMSVVAFSDRDVWLATGSDLARFDGTSWTSVGLRASKLWGRSSTDLWAISEGLSAEPRGQRLRAHFDGVSWTNFAPPNGAFYINSYTDEDLSLGGCDQYFWFTKDNQLNVFDGATWTTSYLDGPYRAAVWGQSPDALIVGGLRGGIMRKTPTP